MDDKIKFELGKIAINEPKTLAFTLFLADENKMRGIEKGKVKWEVSYEQAFAYCDPILKLSHFEVIFDEDGRYLIDWNEGVKMFMSAANVKKLAKDDKNAVIVNVPLTESEIKAYWAANEK
jgi:hypothetical protein